MTSRPVISLDRGRDLALRQAAGLLDEIVERTIENSVERMLDDDCDGDAIEWFIEQARQTFADVKPRALAEISEKLMIAFPAG